MGHAELRGPWVPAGLCEVLRGWGQAQEGPKPGKETFSQTEIPHREIASRVSGNRASHL